MAWRGGKKEKEGYREVVKEGGVKGKREVGRNGGMGGRDKRERGENRSKTQA